MIKERSLIAEYAAECAEPERKSACKMDVRMCCAFRVVEYKGKRASAVEILFSPLCTEGRFLAFCCSLCMDDLRYSCLHAFFLLDCGSFEDSLNKFNAIR